MRLLVCNLDTITGFGILLDSNNCRKVTILTCVFCELIE